MPSAGRLLTSLRPVLLTVGVCLLAVAGLAASAPGSPTRSGGVTFRNLAGPGPVFVASPDAEATAVEAGTACLARKAGPAGKTVCHKRHRGAPEQPKAPGAVDDNTPSSPQVAAAPAFQPAPPAQVAFIDSPPLPCRAPPALVVSL